MSREDRFWSHVDKSAGPDGCWWWRGYRLPKGYGLTRIDTRSTLAHRAAWSYTNGPIAVGAVVCHRCDNPPCCNPTHLFLGTTQDNADDMVSKGRSCRGERNGLSKLDRVSAECIRAVGRARVFEQQQLAKWFGVSGATVSLIVRGKHWRAVA